MYYITDDKIGDAGEQQQEPLYYENFDLESIVSPVKVGRFIQLLRKAKYDPIEIEFLENGLTNGFSLEYEGPTNRQSMSRNIPLTVGNKTELWNKLMKEVKAKRVAGPFNKVPFEHFAQSPIGLVPKANDQTRLIFHLSYNFKSDGLKSINHFIPKEKCMVKYRDLDYAVRAYHH